MNARLQVRLMSHYVDHVTRTTGTSSKSTGLGGAVMVVAAVIAVSAFLVWAENKWGWVQ